MSILKCSTRVSYSKEPTTTPWLQEERLIKLWERHGQYFKTLTCLSWKEGYHCYLRKSAWPLKFMPPLPEINGPLNRVQQNQSLIFKKGIRMIFCSSAEVSLLAGRSFSRNLTEHQRGHQGTTVTGATKQNSMPSQSLYSISSVWFLLIKMSIPLRRSVSKLWTCNFPWS